MKRPDNLYTLYRMRIALDIFDVKKAQPSAVCALRYEAKDHGYQFFQAMAVFPHKKIQALQLV